MGNIFTNLLGEMPSFKMPSFDLPKQIAHVGNTEVGHPRREKFPVDLKEGKPRSFPKTAKRPVRKAPPIIFSNPLRHL